MMMMNQTMSLPHGPLVESTSPEPSSHGPGTVTGLVPNQFTSSMSKRRRTSQYEPGLASFVRPNSSTAAGPQLDDAVRKHEYRGISVLSTYFQNVKLPDELQSFHIAGKTILEIPHPLLPHLFVHPVVASFSKSTLEDHLTNPTDSDWSQVYTLMSSRISKDLCESTHRLKNALELNRIQEYQQRSIPNPQYFRQSGYSLEIESNHTRFRVICLFLQQKVSQMTEMTRPLQHVCAQLSCAICFHSSVADQFENV